MKKIFHIFIIFLIVYSSGSLYAQCMLPDVVPPNIICPTNRTIQVSSNNPKPIVNFTVTVSDNCSSSANITVTQIAGLPSGSGFPVGTTTCMFRARDAAGNQSQCSFTVSVVDAVSPSVVSVNRHSPTNRDVNVNSVTYRVNFSEYVNNLNLSNFSLTTTGSLTGTIASVTDVSTPNVTLFDVVVNNIDNISRTGTLRLDVLASNNVKDDANNSLTTGFTNGEIYNFGNPKVNSIVRQNPTDATITANSVVYRVTFSEAVNNVGTNDFILTGSGTAMGTVASVATISTTEYDVTVNNIKGAGSLRLDVPATATVNSLLGNALNTAFATGDSYNFAVPTANSIVRQTPTTATLINTTSVIFRVSFDKTVKNVDVNDFVLTKTGTANGTIASVSVSTGASIDVTVNNITGAGTLRLDIPAINTINDEFNNIVGAFSSGQVYTIDRVAPTVLSIKRKNPLEASTNAASVSFEVIFSEPVFNITTNRFTAVGIGNINSVSINNGTSVVVTLAMNQETQGSLRLDVAANSGMTDEVGNALEAFNKGESFNNFLQIPENVKAVAGSKQITLSWEADALAQGYEIYMYSANQPQRLVGSTTNATFVVTGLENGVTYFFRLKSVGKQGGSDFSVAISARPSIILSAEEETANNAFKLYPNPSTGSFNIQMNEIKGKNAQISVLDLSGRVVYQQFLQVNGKLDTQLNLNLANGLYLLQLQTEKENLKRKLVIE